MTYQKSKENILANWFDGDENVNAVVGGCEETLAMKCAVKALEKQIPFKPETDELIVGVGRCKCKAEFLDKKTKYCGNCGQALDWGEEE